MTVKDYLDLLTSEFRELPKFTAMISADVGIQVQVQVLLQQMLPLFDVDTAVGQQLDVIGMWVGITRNVAIPIDNVYFSWDADYTLGWDFGTWQPPDAPTSITKLPDDAYRTLIKAKIAANRWDGTTEGAYAIWDQVFTTTTLLIQDNQDMTYDLALVGGTIDSLTLALLVGGYIPLKPEGVRVREYFVSIDSNPIFGWDVDSDLIKGWDEGSWARELSPT